MEEKLEEKLYESHQPLRVLITRDIFLIIITFGFWLIRTFYDRLSCKVIISTEKVTIRKGLISIQTNLVEFFRLKDVQLNQNLAQRIFNTGTLTIYSSDSRDPIIKIEMDDPNKWLQTIRDCSNKMRLKQRIVTTDI